MPLSRQQFIARSLALLSLPVSIPPQVFAEKKEIIGCDPGNEQLPVWNFTSLHLRIPQPVSIREVALLETMGQYFLTVSDQEGNKGITQCNARMPHLVSLLKGLVIPHFLNKDARDIARLVDNAYRLNSNYKYTGMPLWNCIGSVEIAVWDLLGNIARVPVHQLLGKAVRKEYEVYISDWSREGDPHQIAENLLEKLKATGAGGVKIKVGGRMSNSKEDTAQTNHYLPVLRKILGDKITIYADANGSYTPAEGIATGRLLEQYGVSIFEEPCNFEDEEGMQEVTNALKNIQIAGGEQDSSAYRFRRLALNKVYQVLQPDLYYNGGILKTLQVAMIAQNYGAVGIAPHTPKADPLIAPFWQVAALVPNLYGLQECVFNIGEKIPSWHSPIRIQDGKITIPGRKGLGIEYDETIWKTAEKIA